MASRKRTERLGRAIKSIQDSAPPEAYQIRIKIDLDDQPTIDFCKQYELEPNIFIHCAERLCGYTCLEYFYTRMAIESGCPWIWFFMDDSSLKGEWYEQLKRIPTWGILVYPEAHWLNDSRYEHAGNNPFAIIPNQCWEKLGLPELVFPCDATIYELLSNQHHWPVQFLRGVEARHDRDDPGTIEAHRRS